jgi:hypothetical protein
MEFGKDLISALRGRLQPAGSGGAAVHPDWFALRSSQAAAWAARRELLRDAAIRPARAASFAANAAARLLAGYDPSQRINQSALGDGKDPSGNAGVVAGATAVGDRGL